MSERLRARDLAFLTAETTTAPRHNATVEIFQPGESGFDHDRLLALVSDRISFVPRYRQRLAVVPGGLANPVWVDDEQFDLDYHVRRSALPRPGTDDQLRELVSRIVSRRLDRNRPLWEIYVVEGLEGDRVALLYKSHQALVDGVHTVDLGQLLLDRSPEPRALDPDDWAPRAAPSSVGLVAEAVRDSVTSPGTIVETVSVAAGSALRTADRANRRTRAVAQALTGRRPRRPGPVIGPLSQHRRVVTVETRLADYRKIREVHGGTVNDVILACLTGALRAWLMTRAESLAGLRQLRAVVPVSVIDDELEATSLGSQIAAHFVELPISEASPLVRLHQVSYSFQAHAETGRSVAANRLAGIAGFAPTTFHAIGSRVASDELRRGYHISVTNVPGPQSPLYAAGARMIATYPVPPLHEGHPLAIGVTSYDGKVFYGLTADRDALPDADLLGTCVSEALDELLATTTAKRAPRGRKRAASKVGRTAKRAKGDE
ncbi:wax ester/triacylglycerol synthase family O-acyltransferase [Nocardioides sp.]|uniref:WS/DGAT/MGAT family O-acyltransferase n=1 Tax=Nocardioides sp. TaxID=35761 RepID=UPI0027176E02|nr:wax ester/triacylglycerol synthase family O-acyltransferase [Nocardioides sp.]MDO9458241.1 wax ester/triacylglycerol synthase family O-acyltransferase [Nocardioides sp.]